jgi:hypothetical protein
MHINKQTETHIYIYIIHICPKEIINKNNLTAKLLLLLTIREKTLLLVKIMIVTKATEIHGETETGKTKGNMR